MSTRSRSRSGLLISVGVVCVLLALGATDHRASSMPTCRDLAHAPSSRWKVTVDQGMSWLITPCDDRFLALGVNVVDGGGTQIDSPGYASVR